MQSNLLHSISYHNRQVSFVEYLLFIILGVALLYIGITKPVLLFQIFLGALIFIFIWLDYFNGLFCVILIPIASTALYLINPRAEFPFDVLVFGLWTLFLIYRRGFQFRSFRIQFVDKLVVAYILLGLIYLLISSQTQIALKGFKYDHRPFYVYILLRLSGSDDGDWKKSVIFISVLMLFVAFDAFYWYFFDYMTAFKLQVQRSSNIPIVVQGIASFYGLTPDSVARLGSIWMYTTGLGPALMLANIMVLAQRKYIIEHIGKIIYYFCISIFSIALLFTFSRSGILGFVIGIALLSFMERKGTGLRKIIVPTIVAAVVLLVMMPFMGSILESLFKRIEALWTTEFLPGGHFFFIGLSIFIIFQNPWGVGLGTGFASEVGSSFDAVWSESTILKIGSEKGVIAMVLFCAIIFFLLREIYSAMSTSNGEMKDFFRGAFVSGICILLINITFPFWETIMTYYLLFFGVFAINKHTKNSRTLILKDV